jgi:hypothetical protein
MEIINILYGMVFHLFRFYNGFKKVESFATLFSTGFVHG